MNFSCPECSLSGSIDDATIPVQGIYATCPKCKTRFLLKKDQPVDTTFTFTEGTDAFTEKVSAPPLPGTPNMGQTAPGSENTANPAGIKRVHKTAESSIDDTATFVGKNSDTYLRKFACFNRTGTDGFAMTWHWPAFFVPFWWFLYRKQYAWAVLAFFISFIPYVNILTRFIFALSANYIYYLYTKKKMWEIRTLPTEMSKAVAMSRSGGVNNLIWVVAPIIAIAIIGILAAIAIPQFHMYRTKGFNAQAVSELKNARASVDTYYNARKSFPATLEQADYRQPEKIEVQYQTNQTDKYSIMSTHQNGDKEYAVTSDSPVLLYRSKSDKNGDYKQLQ